MRGNAQVKSSEDMKTFVLTGPALKGEAYIISFEFRYDDSAGANLIR